MTAFDDLLANPDAPRQLLVEALLYDPGAPGTAWQFWSTHGFRTEPTDTGAVQNVPFPARVIRAPVFRRSMFSGGEIGGRAFATAGDIVLENSDGALDDLFDWGWDGREVWIRLGGLDFSYSDFGLIFKGVIEGISWNKKTLTVHIKDHAHLFDVPLQPNTYSGAGGLNGGAEVEGRVKPLAYGRVKYVTGVPVDPASLKYQVHDGQIENVQQVYDQGVQLTEVASAPTTGEYAEDLTNGVVELGASPSGTVTVTLQGSKTSGTYVEKTADIVERIAKDQVGLGAPDLDSSSFSTLNTDQPAPVAFFADEPITAGEAIDELINGIGGFWGLTRTGTLQVGQFKAPGTSQATFDESKILSIERLLTVPPIWRRRVTYQVNNTIQSGGELAGSVSAALRATWAAPWLLVEASDSSVKTTHLLAGDPEPRFGTFALKTDASSEASRQLTLYKVRRDILRVHVLHSAFALDLNDTVTIQTARFGFSSGKKFVVIGTEEDPIGLGVILDLWG